MHTHTHTHKRNKTLLTILVKKVYIQRTSGPQNKETKPTIQTGVSLSMIAMTNMRKKRSNDTESPSLTKGGS